MTDNSEFKDIPKVFHSFHEEAPFRNCIECDCDLSQGDCEYVIEKAIKNYPDFYASDVIFDYAICMKCAQKINEELSEESMANIQQFFSENLDIEQRSRAIEEAHGDINKLISTCMITNKPKEKSTEYQIFAHCKGNQINMKNPPYMLSGEILAELAELLSDKTQDELNGFFNKHFSPDPSLMEPTPRLIFV